MSTPNGTQTLGEDPDELLERMRQNGDVMGYAIVATLRQMELNIHRSGWDQPPRLFTVRRTLAGPIEADLELLPGVDALLLEITEVGDAIFAGDGGPQIAWKLERLAGAKLLARYVPENLIAWVLLNEAWTVVQSAHTPSDELQRLGEEHLLHQHPDRIEIRFLLCVDNAGISYQLMRRRDTDTVHVWHQDGPDAMQVSGAIVEGLRAVMKACQ